MLYYIAWLVVLLVAGIVVLWLCKEGVQVFRRVLGIRPENAIPSLTDEIGEIPRNTRINQDGSPWGRGGHQTPATQARTHTVVPRQSTLWGGAPLGDGKVDAHRPLSGSRKRPGAGAHYERRQTVSSGPEGHGTGSSRH